MRIIVRSAEKDKKEEEQEKSTEIITDLCLPSKSFVDFPIITQSSKESTKMVRIKQ